jgi:hypothetical protein
MRGWVGWVGWVGGWVGGVGGGVWVGFPSWGVKAASTLARPPTQHTLSCTLPRCVTVCPLGALAVSLPHRYQPGFEGVDTTIAACVDICGFHDFTDTHGAVKAKGGERSVKSFLQVWTCRSSREGCVLGGGIAG